MFYQSIYNTFLHQYLLQVYGEDINPPCKRCQRLGLTCRSWITRYKLTSKSCSNCHDIKVKCFPGLACEVATPAPTTAAAAVTTLKPNTKPQPKPKSNGKAKSQPKVLQDEDTRKSFYRALFVI
jgi:hypothetical protein